MTNPLTLTLTRSSLSSSCHHQQQEGEVVIQQRERHGESETFLTPGNLGNFQPMREEAVEGPGSAQLKLKARVECKSFDWFLKTVAYDVLTQYPRLPPNQEVGALLNTGSGLCLDTLGRVAPAMIGLAPCSGEGEGQVVRLNTQGQLGVGERCIEATQAGVRIIFCPQGKVSGPWRYDSEEGSLQHSTARRCLTVRGESLALQPCQAQQQYQSWTFKKIKPHWAD